MTFIAPGGKFLCRGISFVRTIITPHPPTPPPIPISTSPIEECEQGLLLKYSKYSSCLSDRCWQDMPPSEYGKCQAFLIICLGYGLHKYKYTNTITQIQMRHAAQPGVWFAILLLFCTLRNVQLPQTVVNVHAPNLNNLVNGVKSSWRS